jgi:hypothetical protein
MEVRARRHAMNIRPVFKRIDTCAGEFAATTPYMYSTYETGALGQQPDCESEPSGRKKAIILGGGPNRIGQGIEFDYCCCHAAFALDQIGIESIMVNCNPETVSTDYDTSDRLYFEPLTAEDVLELIHVEQKNGTLAGVIVQFGGQTPLKLAHPLEQAGVPILGTSPDAIDLAEDRERFQQLLHRLNITQPVNALARSAEECFTAAHEVGYPIVIRPSYVLGGRGMEIVRDDEQLERYVRTAVEVSGDAPILIDQYLSRATEVDIDALCDGTDVFVAGVLEHIEEAGVHSGDSACSMPPFSLRERHHRRAQAPDGRDGPGPERPRTDERAVRHRGAALGHAAHLRAGSEPARLSDRAVRGQDHRPAGRRHRGQDHGRRDARQLRPGRQALRPYRGEGGGLPVRPLRRGRHGAGPGDALDRRGHGPGLEARRRGRHGPRLRPRLRQEPAGRRRHPADGGRGLRLGQGQRQGLDPRAGEAAAGGRLQGADHRQGTGEWLEPGHRDRPCSQGAGGPAAHRRRDEERRGPAGIQHHRGQAVAVRQLRAAAHRR